MTYFIFDKDIFPKVYKDRNLILDFIWILSWKILLIVKSYESKITLCKNQNVAFFLQIPKSIWSFRMEYGTFVTDGITLYCSDSGIFQWISIHFYKWYLKLPQNLPIKCQESGKNVMGFNEDSRLRKLPDKCQFFF